jgi:hypothetical protein
MKGMEETITRPLFTVFIIIMTILILVAGIPTILNAFTSACWKAGIVETNKMITEMKSMTSQTVIKDLNIVLGECIGALIFINDEDLRKMSEDYRQILELKCPSGSKAYVVLLPKTGEKFSWKFWSWPKATVNKVKDSWKKLTNEKPVCKAIDCNTCQFNYEEPVVFEGPSGDDKQIAHCIRIEKISGSYYNVDSCSS